MALIPTTTAADLPRLGALSLVLYTVYALYLHPLARYPGPFWARISTIPSWWATYQQDRHIWLQQLHARYRPDSVAFNTPAAFRAVAGNPKANVAKSIDYRFWPRQAHAASTLQTVDNAEHGRKRRALANAFSQRALRGYEPYVLANMDRWVELLREQVPDGGDGGGWSGSLNAADWFNWSLGVNLRYIIHLIGSMMEQLYPIAMSPIAPFWVWLKPRGLDACLDHLLPAEVIRLGNWFNEALAERTKLEDETRLAGDDSKTRKDFFRYLFDTRDPETGRLGYSKEELFEETQLLVTAGADTTAIVLAAVLFYVVRVEGVQEQLAREVLGAFGGRGSRVEDIVPGAKLQSCKYLRAVISEGLRLAPPVAGDLRREVLPGGTVVEGQFFPAGVVLNVGAYAMGFNEDVFPEPSKFQPERWLVDGEKEKKMGGGGGSTQQEVEQRERARAAFSAGSHGCVGKNLGWMEMTLALAKLVYSFEIRRDPTDNLGGGSPGGRPGRQDPDQYQIYDIFVALRDGPMVQLKKRVHG